MAIKKGVSLVWIKFLLWFTAIATIAYFGYWTSMLFLTKTIVINNVYSIKVPILWVSTIQADSYDFGKNFSGGFYSFDPLGKKASFSSGEYLYDYKQYILTHDLSGLPYDKQDIAGKESLLFEPTSSSFGNWKIYLINLNGKTVGLEAYFLKEKTNVFEEYILEKVENNIIKSISFVKK